jgi:AcrR family transcriptional regulator
MSEKASRRRGAALEEAILDAAWDLLETDGWNGFTFAGVAERAHSSKPVLYRRWRTREELLRATLRRRDAFSLIAHLANKKLLAYLIRAP